MRHREGWPARVLALLVMVAALLASPAAAQTTTACDSGADPLFVLPPGAPGVEYGFAYSTTSHAGVDRYRLRIYDADSPATAAALSTQDVTKAATVFLGTSPATGLGCYALPVIPVAQLPPGKRLTLTVQAIGAIAELDALESGRSPDPFGARLPSAAAPQRKPAQ